MQLVTYISRSLAIYSADSSVQPTMNCIESQALDVWMNEQHVWSHKRRAIARFSSAAPLPPECASFSELKTSERGVPNRAETEAAEGRKETTANHSSSKTTSVEAKAGADSAGVVTARRRSTSSIGRRQRGRVLPGRRGHARRGRRRRVEGQGQSRHLP